MLPVADITGVILAGGESRRFGTNKAFAPLHGVPLVEHSLEVMRKIFSEVLIVTDTSDLYSRFGVPVFQDFEPHQGPLGGIFTALHQTRNDKIFVVGCDMPLLDRETIEQILEAGRDADAAVPIHDGQKEYLMALYSRALLQSMCLALGDGKNSLKEFCCKIPNIEWVPIGGASWTDVDTPEDLEQLEKRHAL